MSFALFPVMNREGAKYIKAYFKFSHYSPYNLKYLRENADSYYKYPDTFSEITLFRNCLTLPKENKNV